jgi:hypothetical protein
MLACINPAVSELFLYSVFPIRVFLTVLQKLRLACCPGTRKVVSMESDEASV